MLIIFNKYLYIYVRTIFFPVYRRQLSLVFDTDSLSFFAAHRELSKLQPKTKRSGATFATSETPEPLTP